MIFTVSQVVSGPVCPGIFAKILKKIFLTQLKRFRRKSLNGGHYTSWNRDRAQFGQPGQIDRLRLSYKFYFNVHNEIIFLWTGNLPKVRPIKTTSESGILTSDQFSDNWKVFRKIQNLIFDSFYLEKRTSFQGFKWIPL